MDKNAKETPNEIVNIIEKIIEINRQNQEGKE